MMGEHLGSPLRFPHFEFGLFIHQFYICRGRLMCLPNLMLPYTRSAFYYSSPVTVFPGKLFINKIFYSFFFKIF